MAVPTLRRLNHAPTSPAPECNASFRITGERTPRQLVALGLEGWEVVSMELAMSERPTSVVQSERLVMLLKRPLAAAKPAAILDRPLVGGPSGES